MLYNSLPAVSIHHPTCGLYYLTAGVGTWVLKGVPLLNGHFEWNLGASLRGSRTECMILESVGVTVKYSNVMHSHKTDCHKHSQHFTPSPPSSL